MADCPQIPTALRSEIELALADADRVVADNQVGSIEETSLILSDVFEPQVRAACR